MCRCYETLGDDIVDDLATVLNTVDASYRLELREQNEVNFVRFEARLREEMATLRADVRRQLAELREEIATLRADLIKWMFVFWIGTMATTVGVVFAVVSLLR